MQFEMDDYRSNLKNALAELRNKDFEKFQDAIKRVDTKDINYYFGDPEHSTLLDLSCRTHGCHQFVECLLSLGADPNIVNPHRKSAPLHFAVAINDFETVDVLLRHIPTNINIADSMGDTALHMSLKKHDIKIFHMLLKDGTANLNAINEKGESILLIAVQEGDKQGNKECIKSILESGSFNLEADPNSLEVENQLNKIYPEWQEIYRKFIEPLDFDAIFNLLHDSKYDEFKYHIRKKKRDKKFSESNDGSNTFLQHCCKFGLVDLVPELLSLGVDVNTTTNTEKKTPLMIASYKGYVDIVRMLLDTNKCSFKPVDQETVLHYIVKGCSESPSLADNVNAKKDHHACLSYLLQVERCKKYINFGDINGNTPLHLAGNLSDSEIILMLLKGGASINCFNMVDEPSFIDINYRTLKEYLDSCVYTNKKPPQDEYYEIIFNYTGLKPVCNHNLNFDNGLENQSSRSPNNCETCNNFETKPLLHLCINSELKDLFNHPVFTSFLFLKWNRVHKWIRINLIFYISFLLTLSLYIYYFHRDFERSNPKGNSSVLINTVWYILAIMVFLLILREQVQFVIAPMNYILNGENVLEVVLIYTTIALLCVGSELSLQYKVSLSAIGIMLSWIEFFLLTGRPTVLSNNLEMLKTVSWNSLKFLAWCMSLIIAFGISFYLLFGVHDCSGGGKDVCTNKTGENGYDFFRNPELSIFKTVIMLTGEFDASSIPFDKRPVISHLLFVAFVFLFPIVLFNLLIGLAVGNIEKIQSDAELFSHISRVELISFTDTLVHPLPFESKLKRYQSYFRILYISKLKAKFLSKHVNILQSDLLSDTFQLSIFPNSKNHVKYQMESFGNRTRSSFSSYKAGNFVEMDPKIVKSAKKLLSERVVENELNEINKKKSEKEELLMKMVEECHENLQYLMDAVKECKEDIVKIKKTVQQSDI